MFSKTVLDRPEASASVMTIQTDQKNARFEDSSLHSVPFVDLSSIRKKITTTTTQILTRLTPEDSRLPFTSPPARSATPLQKIISSPPRQKNTNFIQDFAKVGLAKAARSTLSVNDRTKLDGKLCAAVKPRNNKELEILLQKAADPEAATSLKGHGSCAVLFAACNGQGNCATVCSLLSYGADPNRMNGRANETALLAACGNGAQNAIVYLLLRAGADVNAETIYGETPLGDACAYRTGIGVVHMLLHGGANANPRRAPYQYLPLCQAATKGDSNTVSLLLSYGADLDWALRSACSSLESRTIRPLLELGGNPNGRLGKAGITYLQEACSEGNVETVRVLLEYGADVDASSPTFSSAIEAALTHTGRRNEEILTLLATHQQRTEVESRG